MFGSKRKRQSGAALLMVLAVSAILIPLIQGLWLDTQVEYQFSRYRMNELQARYNAKSGMGLNLLRLYIFKGAAKSIPEGPISSLVRPFLDQIWFSPFVWPLPVSKDMPVGEKEEVQKLVRDSFFRGSYFGAIRPQDGLFDINDLSSPLLSLRRFTYESLLNLLLNAIEESPLQEKYEEKDLREILNNLSDWTDLDDQSQNGGEERLVEEGKMPLNRSFISIEEIKKTPGMTMEIYRILEPHITAHGAKALNINYASGEILQALNIPEGLVEEILSRTRMHSQSYAPFLNQKEFCDFMLTLQFSFCEDLKEHYETLDILTFGYPLAFHIRSTGGYGGGAKNKSGGLRLLRSTGGYSGSVVENSALIYDLSSLSSNYQKSRYHQIQRQKEKDRPQSGAETKAEPEKPKEKEKNKLKIDYSNYKSLIIMYLKEDF